MKYFFWLPGLLFLVHCTQQPTADIIYTNALIWHGDSAMPLPGAIAIKGNTILYTGQEYLPYKSRNTVIHDLQGKLVVPGFIDNHTHFLYSGRSLLSINLRKAGNKKQFIQNIKEFCATSTDSSWVLGGDWDHEAWGGELPNTEWIDSVSNGHPIFVYRYDGHMAFANSIALQKAGINSKTKSPAGGEILIQNGKPTGILKDEAMNLVNAIIPEDSGEELDKYFTTAQQHALENGVTQLADMGSYGGWKDLDCYRRNEQAGKMQLRIYSFVPLSNWQRLDSFCRQNGKGNDKLHWGGLKGFVDGSLGSTTAWFYKPYLDDPNSTGLQVTDTTLLRQWILKADSAGLHIAVHAIGDRANDFILGVFAAAAEKNSDKNRRFRVEHAQHLTQAAIPRFAAQNVIASMQPYHAIDDGKWAYKRLDDERLKGTYAFNSLLQNGAVLTFGSDWPVAPLNPLQGIYAAVTRRTLDDKNPEGWYPQQKITVAQALNCYTAANAYANFMEAKTGKIKTGMLADFVVLSNNIFTIAPEKINEAQVLLTVVDGKEVYKRRQ
jgi:predicted amidohydrolase YtcJ